MGEAERNGYQAAGELTCSLCFNAVQPEELGTAPWEGGCGHSLFHRSCLEDWLGQCRAVGNQAMRCPICMAPCKLSTDTLYFHNKGCAEAAFHSRLVQLASDLPQGRSCDGCSRWLPPIAKKNKDVKKIYRVEWPKSQLGSAGAPHLSTLRFCTKGCGDKWFGLQLEEIPADASFTGSRLLYAPGENTRVNVNHLTPFSRRGGGTLGYDSAFERSNMLGAYNSMMAHFPGMPPCSFVAHLDACAGHSSNPTQIPRGVKIEKLIELIQDPNIRSDDEKFLVFSSSPRLLELVANALSDTYEPEEYVDPETGQPWTAPFFEWAKKGDEALEMFHEPDVYPLALLLESGNFSAGLTLTTASTVFILEPQLDE